jgi:hypothetical protein
VDTKTILILPICVNDNPVASMARLIVIKISAECNTKSKLNPTIQIIIPDNVGFRLLNLDIINLEAMATIN